MQAWKWAGVPDFDDPTLAMRARLLNIGLWLIIVASAALTITSMGTLARHPVVYVGFGAMIAALLGIRQLIWFRRVDLAADLTLVTSCLGVAYALYLDGFQSPAMPSTLTLTVFAGAVRGWRGAGAVLAGFVAFVGALLAGVITGAYIPPTTELPPITYAMTLSANLLTGGVIVALLVRESDGAFQRVEESNLQLRSTLDSLPQGVGWMDADGVLRFHNAWFAERGASLNHPIEQQVPLDDAQKTRVRALVQGALQGTPRMALLEVPDGAGSVRRLQARFSQALRDGELGVQVVLQDDTERYRAERDKDRLMSQLRHHQRLESLGRLAGGVAHDFNNLLTVILSSVYVLPESEAVQDIRQAAEQASSVTRQLLAFSRRQQATPQQVDLTAAIDDTRRMLERLHRGVELSLELPESSAFVWIDPGQLQQVLINLVVNAADAMDGVGEMRVRVVDQPGSEFIDLEVADNGHGIPPESLQEVFEPFFTTKPEGEGTGLGLAVVHGIVTGSGGVIRVDSTVGEGTTFCVRLPRSENIAPVDDQPAGRPKAGKGERILLIEDDAAVRRVVCDMLRSEGFEVEVAADGCEAVHVMETSQIAAVLSDVRLVGETGPDVVDELRQLDPGLPVLYMSGYPGSELPRIGAHALLPKPFRRKQLADAVRGLLDA